MIVPQWPPPKFFAKVSVPHVPDPHMKHTASLGAPMAILVALLMATLTGCTGPDAAPQHFVDVQGEGHATGQPDLFPVQASFARVGKDVAAMKAELDQSMAALLATLSELDIAATDIRAADLSVQPEWQWQPERRLIGQRVSRSVEIRIRDMATYTRVLSVLANSQAERVQPLPPRIDDTQALTREALAAAYLDAEQKARHLAAEAGRELGTVVFITEQGAGQPVPMARMAMESAADQSGYSGGENRIQASVSVRFELR